MKVLMISTDRGIFTAEKEVRQRMCEYGALVEELHIIVFAKRSLGFSKTQIAPNVWAYPTRSFLRLLYICDAIRIGKKITREHKIDLVSTQDPFETGLAGLRISRTQKISLQVQIHTDFLNPVFTASSYVNRVRVRIARKVLPHARGIRVVSQRIKDSFLKVKGQWSNVSALPIFVDIEHIRAAVPSFDLHEKYPQFNFIALAVSRLEKEKNIPLALRAFARVVVKYPKAGLIVAGEGGERAHLESEALSLEIAGNVIFVGWQEDLTPYFKGADVFLSTSKYEGYGLSLIQAAASGCPIVATDAGIAPDLLRGIGHPVLCKVDDEECLVRALRLLVEREDVRHSLSHGLPLRAGRLVPESRETYLAQYLKLWEEVVNK